VLPSPERVILSFHHFIFNLVLSNHNSRKSNSTQNYLVTITLVLPIQIKWFLSLNWNSKRDRSPHLELCSLSYNHFYISVQPPLNLWFYHPIHPFYAKIHLIKTQEISHCPTLESCQFPILFLMNFRIFHQGLILDDPKSVLVQWRVISWNHWWFLSWTLKFVWIDCIHDKENSLEGLCISFMHQITIWLELVRSSWCAPW